MSRLSLYVSEDGRTVLHYSGFSFMAGILPTVWALQRRLYGIAALTLVYGFAINPLIEGLTLGMQAAAFSVQMAVAGGLANRLHAWLLERRGWILTAKELPRPEKGSR